MVQVRKVLNSSVILVKNDQGSDYIVVEKGIGYGRRPGENVEIGSDGEIYTLRKQQELEMLAELLSSISAEYFEITRMVVKDAESELNVKLNEHIYLALTDHLHFAVERFEKNISITNRVFWEMKTFYSKEFQIGLKCLGYIKEHIGIELPEEEAANIAFHIINAKKEGDSQGDAMRAAKFIGLVQKIVVYTMNCQTDKNDIHYMRFLTHMQFFAERFFDNKMLNSEDDFLYIQMDKEFPRAMSCAEKVRTQLIKEYDTPIPNEEVAYLAVHIGRLCTKRVIN